MNRRQWLLWRWRREQVPEWQRRLTHPQSLIRR